MPITAPAEPFTHETGIQFVILPAGRVTSRLSDIELRRALLMSACEVTNAQYEKFVPDHKRTKTSPGDNQPVSNVTGEEAEAFCRWLTKSDPLRRKYRLPDQAEWEYAARGGRDNLLYPWGDDIDESRACYGAQGTKPVGSYPPNRFGLFDVAGNVGEWVIRDDFPPYELRGGSWRDVDGAALRIMAREAPPQKNLELDHHGFRVLCEPPALAR
jgi:formylglycine-generating enzyme required for sulfatase activity